MIEKSQIFYAPSEEGVEIGTYKSSFTKNYWEFRKWFKRAGIEESGITGSGLEIAICADMVIQSGPKWSMMDLQCWCSKNGKIAMRENKSTNKCHWRSKVRKNSKKVAI